VISLGSDQHVVLDALRETQSLEAGERLRSGQRGRFSPAELITALTEGGARSLDLPVGALEVGKACDFIALRTDSMRTIGSLEEQIVLTATSADVHLTVSGGRVRVRDGVHAQLGDVSDLYAEAFAALEMEG
jgi:cytosine/adenosine deaminase-related metal-dependent hydrolase